MRETSAGTTPVPVSGPENTRTRLTVQISSSASLVAFVSPGHKGQTAANSYDIASVPPVAGDDPVNESDPSGDSSSGTQAPIPVLDAESVKQAATAGQGPKDQCPLLPTTTSEFDGSVPVLWHYSDVENITKILEQGIIKQGPVSGPHARYGQGVYLTDITPRQASQAGPSETSQALFNKPYVTLKVQAFVGINVTGVTIGASFPSYNQGTFPGSRNYFHPGPLPIEGQVVAFGQVYYG